MSFYTRAGEPYDVNISPKDTADTIAAFLQETVPLAAIESTERRLFEKGLIEPQITGDPAHLSPEAYRELQDASFGDEFDLEAAIEVVNTGEFTDKERIHLFGAKSRKDFLSRLERVEIERENFDLIYNATGLQTMAGIGAGFILDPWNLVPFGQANKLRQGSKIVKLLRSAKAKGAAIGFVGGTLEEAIIHSNDPNASFTASLVSIGALTTLGAGVGRLIDGRVKRDMQFAMKARKSLYVPDHIEPLGIRADFDAHPAPAYGTEVLAAVTSPTVRMMTSPSKFIRNLAVTMLNTPIFTTDNLRGISHGLTLEGKIKSSFRGYSRYVHALEDEYIKYLTADLPGGIRTGGHMTRRYLTALNRLAGNPSARMRFEDFDRLVSQYRVGAVTNVPEEVKRAARVADEVYASYEPRARRWWESGPEPTKESGLIKFDPNLPTTEGKQKLSHYLNRRWNMAAIKENPAAFGDYVLSQWRAKNPFAGIDEITAAGKSIDNSIRKLVTSPEDRIILDDIFDETTRKSLKSRYWDFIDESDLYQTEWVHKSSKDAMSAYFKSTVTDIEFGEHFGTLSVKEIMEKLKVRVFDEFEGLDKKQIDALNKELVLAEAMIKRVRGTYMDPNSPLPGSVSLRAMDAAMKFNNLRLGGGFLLSSFVDIGRPVMHLGLMKAYGPALHALYGSAESKAIMREMMKKAGQELRAWNVGNEIIMSRRLNSMTDQLPSTTAITKAEKMLGTANEDFFLLNGLSIWNEYMKKNTGIGVVDKIIGAAERAQKGTLGKKLRNQIAQMGLDEKDLQIIAKEFAEHGQTYKGVRLTDYGNWQNRAVLDKLIGAVTKEVDTIIMTPGVGDVPLLMSNAYMKMIFQYKSFALAATTHMLVRGLQQMDANMLHGLLISVTAGASVQMYRNALHGKDSNFHQLILDGIDRSGILGSIGEANQLIQSTPFGNLAITGYTDTYEFDSFGLGPTASGMADVLSSLEGIGQGDISQQTRNAMWRLAPYHNLFYVESLLNSDNLANQWTEAANEFFRGGVPPEKEFDTWGFERNWE